MAAGEDVDGNGAGFQNARYFTKHVRIVEDVLEDLGTQREVEVSIREGKSIVHAIDDVELGEMFSSGARALFPELLEISAPIFKDVYSVGVVAHRTENVYGIPYSTTDVQDLRVSNEP